MAGRRDAGARPYGAHPGLARLRSCSEGRGWLSELPNLVAGCAEQWSLALDPPFPYAFASLALPARTVDGTAVVLKVQYPDREGDHEAAALAHWAGEGAVRLLAFDASRRALLLERCLPGTPLTELDPEPALEVLAELVVRLSVPAVAPFFRLAEEADGWAAHLPVQWEQAGRPFERRLLEAALSYLADLSSPQGAQVLIHQDLHAGNVLAAERRPWLAIDPKPLCGEMEFALAPIVRGSELGHSRALVCHRLDTLSTALGLDRERARGWALAHTLAWAFEGVRVLQGHLEVARWLLEA